MANQKDDLVQQARLVSQACACMRARRLARVVTREYDTALQSSGLKTTQFSLLAAILLADGASNLTRLADKLSIERSALSRNVSLLVARGYLRHDDRPKGRDRTVRITAEGREAFSQAKRLWEGAQAKLQERVGPTSVPDLFQPFEGIT